MKKLPTSWTPKSLPKPHVPGKKLDELTGDGKTRLVVLGAGHMLGSRGIPAQLAERGYRVRRIEVVGDR